MVDGLGESGLMGKNAVGLPKRKNPTGDKYVLFTACWRGGASTWNRTINGIYRSTATSRRVIRWRFHLAGSRVKCVAKEIELILYGIAEKPGNLIIYTLRNRLITIIVLLAAITAVIEVGVSAEELEVSVWPPRPNAIPNRQIHQSDYKLDDAFTSDVQTLVLAIQQADEVGTKAASADAARSDVDLVMASLRGARSGELPVIAQERVYLEALTKLGALAGRSTAHRKAVTSHAPLLTQLADEKPTATYESRACRVLVPQPFFNYPSAARQVLDHLDYLIAREQTAAAVADPNSNERELLEAKFFEQIVDPNQSLFQLRGILEELNTQQPDVMTRLLERIISESTAEDTWPRERPDHFLLGPRKDRLLLLFLAQRRDLLYRAALKAPTRFAQLATGAYVSGASQPDPKKVTELWINRRDEVGSVILSKVAPKNPLLAEEMIFEVLGDERLGGDAVLALRRLGPEKVIKPTGKMLNAEDSSEATRRRCAMLLMQVRSLESQTALRQFADNRELPESIKPLQQKIENWLAVD
jgi:hypothetical protein